MRFNLPQNAMLASRLQISPYNRQDCLNSRPVSRSEADMVQPYHTIRIDQHVSPSLMNIVGRLLQLLPLEQLFYVHQPGARPPQVQKRSRQHVIGAVELAALINENWPLEAGLPNILPGKIVVFKGNDHYLDIQLVKFSFLLTQLREVRPAG